MGEVLIPYIWAATGLVMLVAIVLAIFWAYQHNQFDEDIKTQIFTEGGRRPVRRLIRRVLGAAHRPPSGQPTASGTPRAGCSPRVVPCFAG